MENLNVTDLSIMTDADDKDNQQIVPNIEESLGKKRLSTADMLLVEYLRKHEPVFIELDDVRNKVSFALPSNLFMAIQRSALRISLWSSSKICSHL